MIEVDSVVNTEEGISVRGSTTSISLSTGYHRQTPFIPTEMNEPEGEKLPNTTVTSRPLILAMNLYLIDGSPTLIFMGYLPERDSGKGVFMLHTSRMKTLQSG